MGLLGITAKIVKQLSSPGKQCGDSSTVKGKMIAEQSHFGYAKLTAGIWMDVVRDVVIATRR